MAFENLKKSGIKYLLEKLKDIFVQIRDSVRSVNGTGPDENGDIAINVVPFARGLETESSQSNAGTFVMRTAGGEASIESGEAWLMQVLGNSEHIGYVPESLAMEVIPMERENPITATIDRDVFVAFVDQSGTITLTYTTEWSSSPVLYGVTVTGTPVAGDVISIVYVKEERGTIIQASPQSFVSTGWNLFNYTAGYARVKRYAHGFRIDGTYTSLSFATTPTGTQTEITPTAGAFNPFANLDPGVTEGYVFVTGGNSTDTAVYMTWSDWESGYNWDSGTEQPGEFSAYSQTEVDLSGLYGEGKPLPYGLLSIGTAQDEIDLNLGTVTSRVDRWEWSTSNLATAKASGREYDYDEDYIYIVRATPVVSAVSISGAFTVNDHGLEWFEETDLAAEAHILYGNNLVNKLERDVLTISQQDLTATQKIQVTNNIGAVAYPFTHLTPKNPSSRITIVNNDSYAVGDLIILNAKVTVNEQMNQNVTLFGMPRPVNNGGLENNNFIYRVFATDGTSAITNFSLFVLGNGNIYTNLSIPANTNIFMRVSYIADHESVTGFVGA